MTVSFDISRAKSISAVEKSMVSDQKVFLVTQKNADDQDPVLDQLYHIGCISHVKQLVKMPGGIVRVMVEGLERAELLVLDSEEPALIGEIAAADQVTDVDLLTGEAMMRILKEKAEEYGKQHVKFAREVLPNPAGDHDLENLMLQIAIQFPWEFLVRQEYMEAQDATGRYQVLVRNIMNEIEISQIRREFQEKVKKSVDRNQKEYILREQMKIIREELGEDPVSDADEYEKQVKALKADKEVKDKLRKEIDRFKGMPGGSQEGNVLRTYIETLLELPWNKQSKDNHDLNHAQEILEEDHYGLEKVKERVLEYLLSVP